MEKRENCQQVMDNDLTSNWIINKQNVTKASLEISFNKQFNVHMVKIVQPSGGGEKYGNFKDIPLEFSNGETKQQQLEQNQRNK